MFRGKAINRVEHRQELAKFAIANQGITTDDRDMNTRRMSDSSMEPPFET